MVGCIITGHGGFAPGLKAAYGMIGGDAEDFVDVAFTNENAADYPSSLTAAMDDLLARNGGVVVFCDLMGGTPFNQAMIAAAERSGVEVVAGTNLPMLLECLSSRDGMTAAAVAELAQQVGQESAVHALSLADTAEVEADDGFDGI